MTSTPFGGGAFTGEHVQGLRAKGHVIIIKKMNGYKLHGPFNKWGHVQKNDYKQQKCMIVNQ